MSNPWEDPVQNKTPQEEKPASITAQNNKDQHEQIIRDNRDLSYENAGSLFKHGRMIHPSLDGIVLYFGSSNDPDKKGVALVKWEKDPTSQKSEDDKLSSESSKLINDIYYQHLIFENFPDAIECVRQNAERIESIKTNKEVK
ncbi:MAG: hypothetical protein US30_C0007G0017 [Candidatus Moranbacteria bacterium GW2011_GWF2_36_839]|nr:MAG: hypothetical protein US27_C0007G0033 [Candidatus Moranbacteria bacterium GW2011_GWF1_36_78]KKQ17071.1 MAG: hypothetical protein US30_C0007G0017 [Candidatus Moranbacteria bacterium GW2011_GWF2_36_839]HAT73674.1 hypothetical protein [Candidatus Moranbacteria bacterium]HBY11350.1 hypothetical protein [Candidatus Moranbacteria bacterium]